MTSINPLSPGAPTDVEDAALVARARAGEREALEDLVRRHQAWIYNIAVRMLSHPQDAEDATQEILIKALTALSSFEGRSSFRTWLYRIVLNHVLNARRGRLEPATTGFGCYGHALDATPDLDLPDPASAPADLRLLVDEARMTCTSGMLLCLDREQRLTYILGEIFEVTDVVGAELLERRRRAVSRRPDPLRGQTPPIGLPRSSSRTRPPDHPRATPSALTCAVTRRYGFVRVARRGRGRG